MWARTSHDVETSTELNAIARELLRLDPLPDTVVLSAEDGVLAVAPHGPAAGAVGGCATAAVAAALSSDPSRCVRFTRDRAGAVTIRFEDRSRG